MFMDTVVKPNMVKPCELVRARSREYASTLRSLAQHLIPSCCTSLTFHLWYALATTL